jgi:DNA-binding beta-propeller fold protein YncE
MMNRRTLAVAVLSVVTSALSAQNYADQYLTDPLTFTTIVNSSNNINQPRDLDFKPNTNELWVANLGGSTGSSVVIVYEAGTVSQSSQYRKDTHSSHFMRNCSAIAFSDDIGQWACVSEVQATASPPSTFMGPALWSQDTAIFARAFQNNWVNGLPLGSHYDMLHQSPFAMGIAHDSARAYWVADGHNGNICKYDFVSDHGPGYEDHSAGVIYRYSDVTFSRVANVPGHMILDKVTGWLYYVDSGTKTLHRMNTNTGTVAGPLTVPSTANEPLAGYWNITGAVQEVIDTFTTQICGIDLYNDRMIVGDYTNGNIYLYDVSGANPIFMDTIITGQPGMEGIKFGPDGKIWFVNNTANTVVRIDPLPAINDASIQVISSPATMNFVTGFYSTAFNTCASSVAPTADSVVINFSYDNGPITSYTWVGTLAAGASTTINLPAASPGQGEHLLSVFTSNPNGTPDGNPANDRKDGSFRLLNPIASIPFSEGFGSSQFPPAGWSYVHYNPNNEMTRVTNTGGFGNSSECMKMDHYSGAEDITGQRDHLLTPEIDLSTATSGTTLEFSVAYSQYNSSSMDRLYVKVSTDCGLTWTTLYNQAGALLATTTIHTNAYNAPLSSEWRRESIDLISYLGQPNVIFKFETESNYGNNMFIDDVQIMNTTAINEENAASSVNVFPSPVNTMCVVETHISNAEGAVLSVTNMLGEVVHFEYVNGVSNGRFELDMSKYSDGTYFIHVEADNSASFAKKVTVHH